MQGEACWRKKIAPLQVPSSSIELPELVSSLSFLSTPSHLDPQVAFSLPSWPSSILCKQLPSPETSMIQDHTPAAASNASPASIVSDQATENFYLPCSFTTTSTFDVDTPRRLRPLDKTITADEFGRIVQNSAACFPTESTCLPISTSTRTPSTTISRDTFGNRIEVEDKGLVESDLLDDSSDDDFRIQPGTPLLLEASGYSSLQSRRRDCVLVLPQVNGSPDFRFPALCAAATAQRPPILSGWGSSRGSQKMLLSPIELNCERMDGLAPVASSQAYRQDTQPEPWKNSHIPRCASDGILCKTAAKPLTAARSWGQSNFNEMNSEQELRPNPHLQVSPMQSSSQEASLQMSSASVQTIIDQQREVMEKLSLAGFWQYSKHAENMDKERERSCVLPSLVQEDIVSNVSVWAWLLSSEADRIEEGNELQEVLRSSSPSEGQAMLKEAETETETEASKSWEWLTSDGCGMHDSWESSEESQEVTVHDHRGEEGCEAEVMSLSTLPERCNTTGTPDSSVVGTPDLGQRESRTTAAIEALLTLIQHPQEPEVSGRLARNVGTSYLYHRILQNIAEEGHLIEVGNEEEETGGMTHRLPL